jgi:hypothetical protein
MSVQLDIPYLDDGIRSPNFFNGRLLSGEDLTEERQARQAVLAQLGRAGGDGVAYGLWVSGQTGGGTVTAPVVRVRRGLAVNRLGQPLELVRDLDVSLATPPPPAAGGGGADSGFAACSVVPSDYVAGNGVYLLVLTPAQGRLGRAPASGLGGSPSCAAKHLVDGLRFRLLQLPVLAPDLLDAARLRNRVAHQCLGTTDPAWAATVADPFGPPPDRYGLLDGLRPDRLRDCDVPLAVLHWTDQGGIRFVDNWSVRRRPASTAEGGRLAPALGARRRAEVEAMLRQFQEQVDALRTAGTDLFAWLPPVGLLPATGGGGATGIDLEVFFAGQAHRKPAMIEGARLPALLRSAAEVAPIATGSHELVWLYLVRENQQALVRPGPPQPFVVFASGDAPYLGDARFDLGKWGYASYAIGAPGGAP